MNNNKNLPIDNARLTELLAAHARKCRETDTFKENPPIKGKRNQLDYAEFPTLCAEATRIIQTIIDLTASTPKYRNYAFVDDMKSHAWLCVIEFAYNFGRNRAPDNAHSFVWNIVQDAFGEVIRKEYKMGYGQNIVEGEE